MNLFVNALAEAVTAGPNLKPPLRDYAVAYTSAGVRT